MAKDKRVEVLFEPTQYRLLEEHAHREGTSVGGLIREAVAKYVTGPSGEERQRAWDDFFAMSDAMVGGPSGSPEEIKEEILRGYDEDDARLYETD
jgi:hypothetical protein